MAGSDPPAGDALRIHRAAHRAMACDWQLELVRRELGDDASARALAAECFEEIDRVETELSRFRPDSDVSRIADLAGGASAEVGLDAIECLAIAGRLFRATEGAFDIARGSGFERLHLDRAARRVTVEGTAIALDAGAVGKGLAVDRARAILDEWGVRDARLHCGTSTAWARGRDPRGALWRVARRDPRDPTKSLGAVELGLPDARDGGAAHGQALAGAAAVIKEGHIVDPRTGAPPARALAAWARHPSAAVADAAATALLLAPERAESIRSAWRGLDTWILERPARG